MTGEAAGRERDDGDQPTGKLLALFTKAYKLGKKADIDGTVRSASAAEAAWRRATCDGDFARAPASAKAHSLNSLALAHMRRFWLTKDMRQGAAALEAARRAVSEAKHGTEAHRTTARNASLMAAELQTATKAPEYSNVAIELAREACSGDGPADDGLAESLRALANTLFARFELAGDREDLDEAIRHLRSALEIVYPGSLLAAEYMTNLGAFLLRTVPWSSDLGALDEAVRLQSAAFEQVWRRDPRLHASIGSNLAEALATRAEHLHNKEDRTRSLELLRSLIQLPEAPDQVSLTCALNLGTALVSEYLRSGDQASLNEAIKLFEPLAAATTHADADQARAHFGRMLAEAYHASGRIELLDRSVYMLRLAASYASDTDPASVEVLHSLAIVLHDRFNHAGALADLDEAERSIRRAMDVAGRRRKAYSALLSSAAQIYASRYTVQPDAKGRDELLAIAHRAVQQSASEPASLQANAKTATASILLKVGAIEDRDDLIAEADEMATAALKDVDLARRFRLLSLISDIRKGRAVQEPSGRTTKAAIGAYRDAARAALPGDAKGLRSLAMNWGAWAFQRRMWPELVEATKLAVEASDALLGQQRDRGSYREWIELTSELREGLAYALARCGDLNGAMVEVEKARILGITAITATGVFPDTGVSAAALPDAAAVCEKLANGETLVYWITLAFGAAALVVANTGGATHHCEVLWFDEYDGETTQRLLIGTHDEPGWLPTYQAWHHAGSPEAGLDQLHDFQRLMLGELSRLELHSVVSCLERLGTTKAIHSVGPILALLPMEAMSLGDGRTLIDSHPTSFTPCAAMLRGETPGQLLLDLPAVSISEDDQADLPFAGIEASIVSGAFHSHLSVLRSEVALAHLPDILSEAKVLHFACHGRVDHADPLRSGLLAAADGYLTLEAVLSIASAEPRIAVLAACETGLAGLRGLNAGMSLGNGFLLAGCGAVITSLRAVPDWCVALFIARFCHSLHFSSADPVLAFQEAQRWLRDTAWDEKLGFLGADRNDGARLRLARALERLPSHPSLTSPFYWAAFRILGR